MAAIDEYLENQVLTASPHRLHLMVVEGAIRFARRGQMEMQAERWEAMGRSLSLSRSCVTEMIGGLNVEMWPEMAEPLKSLFMFIYRSLTIAEMERNSAKIDDAVQLLQQHRETWVELGTKLQSSLATSLPLENTSTTNTLSLSWVT